MYDWRGKAVAVTGSLFLSVLFAEGALWVWDVPGTGPFLQEFYRIEQNPGAEEPRLTSKLMCYDSNPSGCLDIDLRDPKQRATYQEQFDDEFARRWEQTPHAVEVRYNTFGVRDAEFQPRREGVQRIVVVGDSFTYGHGSATRFYRADTVTDHGATTARSIINHPIQ